MYQVKEFFCQKGLPKWGAWTGDIRTNQGDFPFSIFFDVSTGSISKLYIFDIHHYNVANVPEMKTSKEYIIDKFLEMYEHNRLRLTLTIGKDSSY